jgi:hypothetical protein
MIRYEILERKPSAEHHATTRVPPIVHEVLRAPGQPLDRATRTFIEPAFRHDFSAVRIHADQQAAASADAVAASAYTVGRDVVFGANQYRPESASGRELLAHELAHVVQQASEPSHLYTSLRIGPARGQHELAADRAAGAVMAGRIVTPVAAVHSPGVQRRVEMRDVGRGEFSGFDRLGELIDRLNVVSRGLTFSMDGGNLAYEVRDAANLSDFDRQMMGFIDQEPVIPLRLTNRHGLLGDRVAGFNFQVEADAWASGYVDIDDLLASSDVGLQLVLVHFLRERAETRDYARRIGSASMTQAAFDVAHARGIDSEVQFLRDFFGDPTIRFTSETPVGQLFRFYRNSRGDSIRARMRPGRRAERGVDAVSVEVRLRDGRTMTAEEYRDFLEQERIREQVERERLGGATEHRAGGRSVPAP